MSKTNMKMVGKENLKLVTCEVGEVVKRPQSPLKELPDNVVAVTASGKKSRANIRFPASVLGLIQGPNDSLIMKLASLIKPKMKKGRPLRSLNKVPRHSPQVTKPDDLKRSNLSLTLSLVTGRQRYGGIRGGGVQSLLRKHPIRERDGQGLAFLISRGSVTAARDVWFNKVDVTGWLQAFSAHPQIGHSPPSSSHPTSAQLLLIGWIVSVIFEIKGFGDVL
ncbi:hypothetical protein ACLB2K_073735 [Fragaria x ananassa]